MDESKIELTSRLRREGRWGEASKFKDTVMSKRRAEGMRRAEASEAAWGSMGEAYPPLAIMEGVADLVADPVASAPEAATTYAPPIPWRDLPTDADFDEEVRWVHQQYILIVEETARGRVIHWERATQKPPSTGACSLALWAADNRTAFYKDLLPKTMAGVNSRENEEGLVREERRSIADVERIIGEMGGGESF